MLIKHYNPEWPIKFERIRKCLERSLLGLNIDIEHIGSTSVPNLASKPIIDIDIIYAQATDFETIKSSLEKIGYYHNGNQGIEDREVFKRNGKMEDEIFDTIAHHLYVCSKDSKALERHILSRNFLRKNEWARQKYEQMKYELAKKANQDRKVYAALKELTINDFIDSIIEQERQNTN